MKSCVTCGMPFEGEHTEDIGMEISEGPVCKYDCVEGVLKTPEEIFEGGVAFFTDAAAGGDRSLGERLTRKNMKSLSYWQSHPFTMLDGDEATDEEFADAMSKM